MHVMIDLETLSLRPDAAILQIAAVEFEPFHGGSVMVNGAFCLGVDLFEQKRDISKSTTEFWQKQTAMGNTVLLNSVTGNNTASLPAALLRLVEWWRQRSPIQAVWSHGAAFDLPILTHAFMQDGYASPPWSHRQVRDTRTLYMAMGAENHPDVTDRKVELESALGRVLFAHDALDDAIMQCLELQKVLKP